MRSRLIDGIYTFFTNGIRKCLKSLSEKYTVTFITSPTHILIIIPGTLFVADTVRSLLLTNLPVLSQYSEGYLNSFVSAALLCPVIYVLIAWPLRRYNDRRDQLEKQQKELINALREALRRDKAFNRELPMCISCKKIRDDAGIWNQVDDYIYNHSNAQLHHSICPECTSVLQPNKREF